MKEVDYKDVIVKKPWGREYLCYQNEELAIWLLYIGEGQKTSFHCHPNKNTGFIVLEGEVELTFMRHSVKMSALDKIHIFRARFHSTKAVSEGGALVMEIETPEDKKDLVRLHDDYGREGEGYEGRNFETPKNEECIWISEPSEDLPITMIGNCQLSHIKPGSKSDLYGFGERDYFVIARGGIATDNLQKIIWPGDVIDGISLEKLLRPFNLIDGSTLIKVSS